MQPFPPSEIEALVTALQGVIAATAVLDDDGELTELHVLADERLHAKQIVRNIESALSGGLGIVTDRRVISVAQMRAGEEPPQLGEADAEAPAPSGQAAHAPEAPAPAPPETPDSGRYIFVGYDARTRPDLEATCRVSIRRGNEVISGTGTGPSTQTGRAQAAARAVFAAIGTARRDHSLGFEGATLVENHGRQYVLVAANAAESRNPLPLTGIAALHRSPEEAAILAALQATNRWSEIDG